MSQPMKYRTKPASIEAMQWDGSAESARQIINWALSCEPGATIKYHPHLMDGDLVGHPDPFLWIDVPEQRRMIANPKDYIVKNSKGEFYRCKPGSFEANYEEAN